MSLLAQLRSLLPRSFAGRAALGASLVYATCTGILWAFHRAFIFPAPRSGLAPTLSGSTLLKLDAEGSDVVALYAPPSGASTARAAPLRGGLGVPQAARDGGVVVFFHGNGQELVDLSWLARSFMNQGLGILFVEYPGYGLAKGETTEANIYFAAKRALDELQRLGVAKSQITLVGQSLGSGVAIEMARGGYGSKLVLISPFTSMVDMVKRFAPLLPVSALVRDRFDNLAKAPEVPVETLVIHGTKDGLVPVSMGREIAAAIPNAKLIEIEGGSHNDLFTSRGASASGSETLRLIIDAAKRGESRDRPNPLAN